MTSTFRIYFEAPTLVVQEERTFNKYTKTLDAKYLASLAGQGHQFFTEERASAIIQRVLPSPDGMELVEERMGCCGGEEKPLARPCTIRKETDVTVVVTFSVSTDMMGIVITDDLFVQCTLIEERDEVRKIKRLEAELASVKGQLVSCMALARRAEITRMYTDTIAIFGKASIPPSLFDFAKQIFAAEIDGNPYIFDIIRPNMIGTTTVGPYVYKWVCPYWLRSVVCVISPAFPIWHQVERIDCRRIIVASTGYYSLWQLLREREQRLGGQPPDSSRCNEYGSLSMTKQCGTFPIRFHPNVESLVILSDPAAMIGGEMREQFPLDVFTRLAPVVEKLDVILPMGAKAQAPCARSLIRVRFLENPVLSVSAPTKYEATGLQKYFAEAEKRSIAVPAMI